MIIKPQKIRIHLLNMSLPNKMMNHPKKKKTMKKKKKMKTKMMRKTKRNSWKYLTNKS
jgi:hypothetical protein